MPTPSKEATTNTRIFEAPEAPAPKSAATEPKSNNLIQADGSYTKEEQMEMSAAQSDSEPNAVKPKPLGKQISW